MSVDYREIKTLRKEHKWQNALDIIAQLTEAQKEALWCKREMAWLYYDMIKQESCSWSDRIFYMKHIGALELPPAEEMFWQNVMRLLVSLVAKNFDRSGVANASNLDKVIEAMLTWCPARRMSESATFINVLLSRVKEGVSFQWIALLQWWCCTGIHAESYKESEYQDKKIPALVDRSFGYGMKVLRSMQVPRDPEIIRFMTETMETFVEAGYSYKFFKYYIGCCYEMENDLEKAQHLFRAYMMEAGESYWLWDHIALCEHDMDLKIAFLAKGFLQHDKLEFRISVGQRLVELLSQKGQDELVVWLSNQLIKVRKEKGWKIPAILESKAQERCIDNKLAYTQLTMLSKPSIAWMVEGMTPKYGIVETVDKKNRCYWIAIDSENTLRVQENAVDSNVKRYDMVAYYSKEKGSRNAMWVMTSYSGILPKTFYQAGSGTVKRHRSNVFGFVHDLYIHPDLIKRENLRNGSDVMYRAIYRYHSKKDKYEWRLLDIKKIEYDTK
ncbi:hypothetical protein K4L44_06545 [Halosquirtibacter laminarini]|uniref:Uncharacterized protein n=1 Tax=Halosquirtibacter laminarini TaxID=3374600 RepID=A0AC61NPJ1_9BACT|nr:hypothetical protein K4L44_06545 [Prolixibacteraceae bacterium]